MGEPLLISAAVKYYTEGAKDAVVSQVLRHFSAQVNSLVVRNPSKGYWLERLVAAELIQHRNKHLYEVALLRSLFSEDKKQELGRDTVNCLANLKFRFAAMEDQSNQSFLDFCSRADTSSLLSPASTVGPDWVGFLSNEVTLVCACRIYAQKIPREKAQQNMRSTDIRYCYYTNDGSRVNRTCRLLRSSFVEFLNKAQIKVLLKIVLSLPCSDLDFPELHIESLSRRDRTAITSILFTVTENNISELFSPQASSFLLSLLEASKNARNK